VYSRARAVGSIGRGFERWSWYFFRVSGLLLVILALCHVLIVHVVNDVEVIHYGFVAERWRSVGWRLYDWLLLSLALSHGMNGLRLSIDDYVHAPGHRRFWLSAAGLLYLALLAIGTATIVTFPLK
jgi:succinate dehydrogenase / fumarate reductase membrane anchor subunit